MKISATLKGRPDAFGRLTVNLRIAEGKERKFQVTHIRVKPSDFKHGMIAPSHPDHIYLNHKILEMIMEVEKRGGFIESDPLTFDKYSESLIDLWTQTRAKAKDTIKHYRSGLKKFNEFAPGILLSKIDRETLELFQKYCYSLGNEGNTVWNALRFVRLIILEAYRQDKIKDNPFKNFDMPKYRDPHKLFLTDPQLKEIEKSKETQELMFAATWFLIGCYSGLRYSDMANFSKKKNVRDGRLVVFQVKTGEPVGMPIEGKLKELFELINYEPMNYTNVHFNRLLKIIAEQSGIEENLTCHCSRHTFAMRLANAGISQEVAARLLGHNRLQTTSIYYKISNKRVDDELKKLK